MALAQCVSGAPRLVTRATAIGASRRSACQLNVFAWEADVAVEMAAALRNPPDLLIDSAMSFSQPRKHAPLVHDSTQVDMQAISTT